MLTLKNLTASYGYSPVIGDVNVTVQPGEIVGVLGRNGSGKSTTIKAIMGLLPSIEGEILLGDKQLIGLPTHRIARLGVAYVPQGRGIFPRLTVRENLEIGARVTGNQSIPPEIFEEFPILKSRLSQYSGTMSGGEQQLLAIARALCSRPQVVLLDEPSDGVQPSMVEAMGELIPTLTRDRSLCVLLVEQNLDLALTAANRVVVMDRGKLVHQAPAAEFLDPEVQEHFLSI